MTFVFIFRKKIWLILFVRPSLTVGVPIRLYTPCGRRVSKTFMLRHSPNIIIWRLCPLWHHTVTDMSKSETRRCSALMQNSITVLLRTITLSLPVECQAPYASVHGHWLLCTQFIEDLFAMHCSLSYLLVYAVSSTMLYTR